MTAFASEHAGREPRSKSNNNSNNSNDNNINNNNKPIKNFNPSTKHPQPKRPQSSVLNKKRLRARNRHMLIIMYTTGGHGLRHTWYQKRTIPAYDRSKWLGTTINGWKDRTKSCTTPVPVEDNSDFKTSQNGLARQ